MRVCACGPKMWFVRVRSTFRCRSNQPSPAAKRLFGFTCLSITSGCIACLSICARWISRIWGVHSHIRGACYPIFIIWPFEWNTLQEVIYSIGQFWVLPNTIFTLISQLNLILINCKYLMIVITKWVDNTNNILTDGSKYLYYYYVSVYTNCICLV